MKVVILDRDGVINQDSDAFIKSEEEWLPIEGSIDAIAKLYQHGFKVFVATNQSGLGRGYFSETDLNAMHNKMTTLVEQAGGRIEGIFYCPHTPDNSCSCRKPLPGLLNQIEQQFDISLAGSAMVGDSLRDLQAGIAKGCTPLLVKTGKGEKTAARLVSQIEPELKCAKTFTDLAAVADYLTSDNS
jgi:D-glycero-D-manno-heptose 1,7-bisphosphate phosphatase